MEIKVFGTGCAKCKTLEKNTREAVAELGLDADVKKVEDIMEIMGYGVSRTPAIMIGNKVVVAGKAPSAAEIKKILTQNQ
ncbi:redox-active disulfide protein 2 [Salinivirga cyanobacteriivorans]|uniref:Redox-active disulfide protein 2 n=1 Tax=Salinivirga cyanobacteriivorans TaxID=1307839 RepID=A0A0S2I1N8_9BACT|nr:thioredoxin family protein [Salinivirga cyanobacteriivorans]ALO16190.1 redox-active disulfide protein 2 [Salinivirga cyanobacteriivorans]